MNFTREPIIETIISAKDGHKLSIKSSKSATDVEYLVDAVEVVSFGGSFFYRSQERAKAFFLPSNDYEIQEVKETRLIIKNPTIEKSVKIGSSKEGAKTSRGDDSSQKSDESQKGDGKRDKRKNRKGRKAQTESAATEETEEPKKKSSEGRKKAEPVKKSVSDSKKDGKAKGKDESKGKEDLKGEEQSQPVDPGVFSHLLKPPENLISDTIEQYKREDGTIVPIDAPTPPPPPKELKKKSPTKSPKSRVRSKGTKSSEGAQKEKSAPEAKEDTAKTEERKVKMGLMETLEMNRKREMDASEPPLPPQSGPQETELYSEPPAKGEKLEEPKLTPEEPVAVTHDQGKDGPADLGDQGTALTSDE